MLKNIFFYLDMNECESSDSEDENFMPIENDQSNLLNEIYFFSNPTELQKEANTFIQYGQITEVCNLYYLQ